MNRHIEEQWQALLSQLGGAMPRGEQRRRMRATFFCGANTMMHLIATKMKDRNDSAFIDELQAELREFASSKPGARR